MSYYPQFSELLGKYLHDTDRSQSWLARNLGIQPGTVNRWLNQETRPDSPETVSSIADLLGIHAASDRQALLVSAGYGYLDSGSNDGKSEKAARASNNPTDQVSTARFTFLPVPRPSPPPNFSGRRDVLNKLSLALNSGECVAIQGMAGVGKTATAQQVAEEVGGTFLGGIFWGSLADYGGNPLPILRTWERACTQDLLDVNDPIALSDWLHELLVNRKEIEGLLLVIVDDVREEWLDAARILKRVLPADIPMIITTRDERLAMALEMEVHRLEPLPLEDALDMLPISGSEELVKAETESAKELLNTIGRLPLAIKLAGARLAMLARKPGFRISALTEQVRSRADDALAMPGDRGLVATFGITYDALTADQQRLFCWLSVLTQGPIRVPQVAGMLGMEENQASMALDTLVLLSVLNWGEVEGEYLMHPLLRQYAAIHLEGIGEKQEAEQHHLAYYLSFAKANQAKEPDAWDRLEDELPNLMLAVKRAASRQDSKALLAFEEALLHDSLFLNVRSQYNEAVDLFTQSLDVQERLGEQEYKPRTINKLAWFYYSLGEFEKAQRCAKQGYAWAVELSDLEQQADSLRYQGVILADQGFIERSIERQEDELAIRRMQNAPLRLASSLENIAMVEGDRGEYAKALGYLDEVLAIYQDENELEGILRALSARGSVAFYIGDYSQAQMDFQNALKQSQRLSHQHYIAHNYYNLGMIQACIGDYSASIEGLETALNMYEGFDSTADVSAVLTKLAEVYIGVGNYQRATELLHTVCTQVNNTGDIIGKLEFLNILGASDYANGKYENALRSYKRLKTQAKEAGLKYLWVQSLLGVSQVYLAVDDSESWAKAKLYASEAVELCQKLSLSGDQPRGQAYLAKANLLLANQHEALQNCRDALQLLERQKHTRSSEAEIFLTALEIFSAHGLKDECTRCLEQAYGHVTTIAEKIEDAILHQTFLAVPVNRQIVALWQDTN